ncbi:MAG: aldehyde ferredoxin oxidoreductase family protein [Chloroflexi bacterium]|nr:aldehyde ferredoxin oxidoreductase family protein [Chloroflexota bacterium]
MACSYHRKVLRVDLTSGTVRVDEPSDAFYRRNMGGWNLIAEVLLREVPVGADPLGPANKLVFAPGVLTGLALSGASRNAIGAKSPLTGAFGAAEVGGGWAAQLKQAGYDAIIFEGASPRPVYLWVHDGQAELRDAAHLWGQDTQATEDTIRTELGDRHVECTLIGPGGENLVAYACIMNGLKDAAGRSGLGAVMGSKRLKAVAVRGTRRLETAEPERIHALAREMARLVTSGEKASGLHNWGTGGDLSDMVTTGNLPTRNFRDGDFEEGAVALSSQTYMPVYGQGMEGCWACVVRCKKVFQAESPHPVDPAFGGPEYETVAALGSCCGVADAVAVARASQLCNAYSLDTIATGMHIAFAMECYERGLLTGAQVDGLDLRFGNAEAMLAAVEAIAHRTPGLGELLSGSVKHLAERLGGEAPFFAMEVKGQDFPMHEPRFKRALAIGYAVSPTGADHCHSLHDSDMNNALDNGLRPAGTLTSLGVISPMPVESLGPEKVRAAIYHTLDQVAMNCMALSLFVPWTIEDKVAIVRAATGWDVTSYELMKVGERAYTLARVYNAREGFTAADDRLPARSYGPTANGALDEGGIDPELLQEAMHTFYGMMGWDEETGIPSEAKLHELDLAWAIPYLPKR